MRAFSAHQCLVALRLAIVALGVMPTVALAQQVGYAGGPCLPAGLQCYGDCKCNLKDNVCEVGLSDRRDCNVPGGINGGGGGGGLADVGGPCAVDQHCKPGLVCNGGGGNPGRPKFGTCQPDGANARG